LQTHRDHPALEVAVVGKVTQSPELTQSLFMRKWEPIRFGNVKQIVTLPYYLFWACHVSAKRDFLLSVGMFREHRGRAGAASHEDVELGYRLHQRGLRLLYNPRATAHHYHVETLEKAMQRAYERGLNFDEFRQYVPAPEVVVRYHLIAWRTLADHARVYAGQLRTQSAPARCRLSAACPAVQSHRCARAVAAAVAGCRAAFVAGARRAQQHVSRNDQLLLLQRVAGFAAALSSYRPIGNGIALNEPVPATHPVTRGE